MFPFLVIMNEVDCNTHIQVLFHHNFSFLIGKHLGLELMNFICAVLSRFSHVQLFATLWTVAHQAPLSMGFSRQEYWCGLPYLPPGYLPNSGIKPRSPALQADSFPVEPPRNPSVPKRSTKSITAVLKCGHGRKKLEKDKIPV